MKKLWLVAVGLALIGSGCHHCGLLGCRLFRPFQNRLFAPVECDPCAGALPGSVCDGCETAPPVLESQGPLVPVQPAPQTYQPNSSSAPPSSNP